MSRRRPVEVLRGGCPCGWWALVNCRYAQAVGLCRTPLAERPAPPSPDR